jgi:Putative auto-transporter adhesin, head GIN domain
MKRALYTTLVAGLAALVAIAATVLVRDVFHDSPGSEVRGSGAAASEARALPAFDRVNLSGSNKVVIRVGPKQTVVVHTDDNLVGRVMTNVERRTLVVGDEPGSYTTKSPTYIEITTPSLRGLTLSGSGVVSAVGIDSPWLKVALPGSGLLRASGRAEGLDVALGGSGDAQLGELVARDARVVVSGSGRADVTATKSLDAAVSGTGAILYGGHPAGLTTSVTGVGAITAR